MGDANLKNWNTIYKMYHSPLKGYILANGLAPHEDAADMRAHDCLSRAWQYRRLYNPNLSSLFTWLCMFARNDALDFEDETTEECASESGIEDENGETPDEIAQRNEQCELLLHAVDMLEEPERAVMLSVLDGLRNKQIASELGRTIGEVKAIRRRAKVKLRRLLGADFFVT